jgi:hypothetical protein
MHDVDRDKLVKLLRMFSSDFDGEVASAARRAHELVKSRALDWDDLLIISGRTNGGAGNGGNGFSQIRARQQPG